MLSEQSGQVPHVNAIDLLVTGRIAPAYIHTLSSQTGHLHALIAHVLYNAMLYMCMYVGIIIHKHVNCATAMHVI